MTDFLRYHVLIRVFGGDVDAWLEMANNTDRPFLRWLKRRIDEDASLLMMIASAVEGSGLWPERAESPEN